MAYPGINSPTLTPSLNGGSSPATTGMAVYLSASSTFKLAESNQAASSEAIGIVFDPSIAAGATGNVATGGSVTLTATQLIALGISAGVMVVDQAYYVSATSPGLWSVTPPTTPGQYITLLGVATSPFVLYVAPQSSIRVGSTASTPGVVFVAGQSNASYGIGDASTLGGGWTQFDPNIPMFKQVSPAGVSPVWINAEGNLGPFAPTSVVPNMGVEISLGKTLYANGNAVIIGQFGQAETDLATDWNPTGTYPSAFPNNLFGQMVTFIQTMLATTGAPLRAFVWIQGESDAISTPNSNAYGANLAAFFVALRAALGMPALPVVVVRLNGGITIESAGNVATIHTAQTAYVASDPRAALVNTDDLASAQGASVDYNTTDLITIGNRCAAAVSAFIPGAVTSPVARDTTSLAFLPATNTEWTTLLTGLPGAPQPPTVLYNFQNAGADANGLQDLTVGSGVTAPVPNGWSRFAMTQADDNAGNLSSTAGPVGDPYAASHLVLAIVLITDTPAATRDIVGIGGAEAYRGIQITSGGLLEFEDLGGGDTPTGTFIYGSPWHAMFLQIDRTNAVARIVTDREVITQDTYNAPSTTTKLFTVGSAATTSAPMQVPYLCAWRGSSAEMSLATLQGIIARINAGSAAWGLAA